MIDTDQRQAAIGISGAIIGLIPSTLNGVATWLQIISLSFGATISAVMLFRMMRRRAKKK